MRALLVFLDVPRHDGIAPSADGDVELRTGPTRVCHAGREPDLFNKALRLLCRIHRHRFRPQPTCVAVVFNLIGERLSTGHVRSLNPKDGNSRVMNLKVFIQNEAGSTQKHYHNEKTLQWRRTEKVSRPYPYPYGFILGTTRADGANLDCFVITEQHLKTGDLVDCEVFGLMQQIRGRPGRSQYPGSAKRSRDDQTGIRISIDRVRHSRLRPH